MLTPDVRKGRWPDPADARDMRADAKPGNSTTVVLKDALFDRPVTTDLQPAQPAEAMS